MYEHENCNLKKEIYDMRKLKNYGVRLQKKEETNNKERKNLG